MELKSTNKKKELIFSIILLSVLIVLAYVFPYTGDDWAWGSKLGLERLQSFFQGYNGRYLGNIIVIILTRSQILKTIAIAGVLFGIIALSYKFTNKKNMTLYLISTVLILAMPRLVLRQSIVWTSGFTNYAISALLILVYIYYIKNIFEDSKPEYSNKMILPVFVLSFSSAFFVEHVTLYSVVLSVFVIIYTYVKHKKFFMVHISYLIGSVLGMILMFSNSAYYSIAEHHDNYRSVPDMSISALIMNSAESYFKVIYKEAIFNNISLNIIIAFIVILIVYKYYKRSKENIGKLNNIIINICTGIITTFPIYTLIKKVYPEWGILLRYTVYFEGLYSIIFYLAIVIISIITIENKTRRDKILFLLGSIIVLIGPLFIVKPIGSRCFLVTYVLFIMVVNEFIDFFMLDLKNELIAKLIKKMLVIMCIVLTVYLLSIYLYIFKTNNERIDHVNKQVANNSEIIEISRLPYEMYLWTSSPLEDGVWEDRFKWFYGVPDEVDIVTLSLEKWHDKYSR